MSGQTDGYITTDNAPGGAWSTTSVGQGRSEIPGLTETGVYVRLAHPDGPIPGTKCTVEGVVEEGATISFTSPGDLLSGAAPDHNADRPYVVWAGVSPMSLGEILVVWNTNVVLLNKSKVQGGTVTALVGRLMVLTADGGNFSVTGLEQRPVTISPGAVGFYKDADPPKCEEDEAGDVEGFSGDNYEVDELDDVYTQSGGGYETLADPDDPEPCSEDSCADIVFEFDGDGGDPGNPGDDIEAKIFSTLCNPSAQCGDFAGSSARFIVNNALSFPVRCVYPFYLELTHSGFGDCPCEDDNEGKECGPEEAEAWMVAMEIYGGTQPAAIFPLTDLQSINPCAVGDRYPNGYPATMNTGSACNVCSASVTIRGAFGPPVSKIGKFTGTRRAFAGQTAAWSPVCFQDAICGCTAIITLDQADTFAYEDVIKPVERTVPVSFFDTFEMTTTEVEAYTTTTTQLDVVTKCVTDVFDIVTDCKKDTFDLLTDFTSDNLEVVTNCSKETIEYLTDVETNVVDVAQAPPSGAGWVLSFENKQLVVPVDVGGGTSFDLVTSVPTTVQSVVTDCEGVSVHQIATHDAGFKPFFLELPPGTGDIGFVKLLGDNTPDIGYTNFQVVLETQVDTIKYVEEATQYELQETLGPLALHTPSVLSGFVLNTAPTEVTSVGTDPAVVIPQPVDQTSYSLETTPGADVLTFGAAYAGFVPQTAPTEVLNVGARSAGILNNVSTGQTHEAAAVPALGSYIGTTGTTVLTLCDAGGGSVAVTVITSIERIPVSPVTIPAAVTSVDWDANQQIVTTVGTAPAAGIATDVLIGWGTEKVTSYALNSDITPAATSVTPIVTAVGTAAADGSPRDLIVDWETERLTNYSLSETPILATEIDITNVVDVTEVEVVTDIAVEVAVPYTEDVVTKIDYAELGALGKVVTSCVKGDFTVINGPLESREVIIPDILERTTVNYGDLQTAPAAGTNISEVVDSKGESKSVVTDCEKHNLSYISDIDKDPQVELVTECDKWEDVTVVTSCEKDNPIITMPSSTGENTYMKPTEGGSQLALETQDPGCGVRFKFLNHDGQINYTIMTPDGCDEPSVESEPHPVEDNCENFLLLRGNYFVKPASPTAESCPCWDGSPETLEGTGGSPIEAGPGGGAAINPCTTQIRRVNRRWCYNVL